MFFTLHGEADSSLGRKGIVAIGVLAANLTRGTMDNHLPLRPGGRTSPCSSDGFGLGVVDACSARAALTLDLPTTGAGNDVVLLSGGHSASETDEVGGKVRSTCSTMVAAFAVGGNRFKGTEHLSAASIASRRYTRTVGGMAPNAKA